MNRVQTLSVMGENDGAVIDRDELAVVMNSLRLIMLPGLGIVAFLIEQEQ